MSDTESITGSEEVASPEENVVGERLRGDGQENQDTASKKVDDDEDRRNPQYIPKRGNFYEHDDRTAEDAEENTENPEAADKQNEKDNPKSKKQVWEENVGGKWQHDLYNDVDQLPKTKDEIIEVYGYDIRNEDGPPRARRRRRYGRGPNKYTRNWEDEEAYTRPINQTPRRKNNPKQPPGKEEFPPLVPGKTDRIISKNNDLITEESLPSTPEQQLVFQATTGVNNKGTNETPKSVHPVASNAKTDYSKPSEKVQKRSFRNSSPIRNEQFSRTNTQVKNVKQQQNSDQRQQRSDSRPNRKSDQINNYRNIPQETRGVKIPPITSQSFTNTNRAKQQQQSDVYDINKEMSTLKINEPHTSQNSSSYNRQATVPPRLQNEQQRAGGPKRYSSLRQRSLPETTQPAYAGPQQINASYYPQEYTQQQNLEGNLLPPHPHSSASTLISHNQELPPQQPILPTETPQTLLVTHGGQPQPMLTQTGNIPGLGHTVTHSGQVQPMMTQAGLGLPHSAQHQPILTQAGPILSQNGLPHAPNQGQPLLPPNQTILPQGQPLLPPQHHPAGQGQPLAGLPQHPPQPQIISQDVVLCESHPGQFAQYQAQSAAYLQQSVTGPPQQFIPQQQPVINYAAAPQPQFVPQPQPGAYPAFQPAYNPTTSTQDLYQPQGGITYYSPHTQQSVARPPQKRPKAAIPILAPPEKSRGRGKNNSSTELYEIPKSRGRGRIPLEENNSEPNFDKSTEPTGDTLEKLSPNEDKLDLDQSELTNKSDQVFENAPENIHDEDIKIVPEAESVANIVDEKQKNVDATSNNVSENANTDQLDVKTNLSEEQLDTTITSIENAAEDSKDDFQDAKSE